MERIRPDAIRVLRNKPLVQRLSWYFRVLWGERPARYRIAKRLESPEDPYQEGLTLDDLWRLHDRLAIEYKKFLKEIEENREKLPESVPPRSYLDVKIAISRKTLESCNLCEWKCRANRASGRQGVCKVSGECIVYSYFHHMGEEAPLVPSGTIFYGGCPLKCVFCQNWEISQRVDENYIVVTPEELAEIQEELAFTGARNINHVGGDPIPHIPFILESFKYLDVNKPQLWNSNMYLSEEGMKLIADIIDIWLPDFKYGNNACALRLSKCKNYVEVVIKNLSIAYNESDGNMIVRHLVLPNHIECCTRRVLEWMSKNIPKAVLNLMDQYHPDYLLLADPKAREEYKEIARRLSAKEIEEALAIAKEYGYSLSVEELLLIP
ncbi:MAG: radical SAM protein [Acidilobaceae archaeon]